MYTFGFNGMEMDNEVHGNTGDMYTTEFRAYDARLGKWLSKDPIVKPWESPYVGFANNPIRFSDPSGLDPIDGKGKAGDTWTNTEASGKVNNWNYVDGVGWELNLDRASERAQIDKSGDDIGSDFINVLRSFDRALMGNSGLSIGVSIEGREANNNKLASTAAPGAKILTVQKETFDLLGYLVQNQGGPDSKTPYSYNKWKTDQNNRLTDQRNTGSSSPALGEHRFGDLLDASENHPMLGQNNTADNIQAELDRNLVWSDDKKYLLIPIIKVTGDIYYEYFYPTELNKKAARKGIPVPLNEVSADEKDPN